MTNGAVTKPLAVTVGESQVRVWGMTSQQRLARTYGRLGLAAVDLAALPDDAGEVMIVHAGWIYDEAVVRALAARPGVVLADEAGRPVAAHVPAAKAAKAAADLLAGKAPARSTAVAVGSPVTVSPASSLAATAAAWGAGALAATARPVSSTSTTPGRSESARSTASS